jgi:amino acid adenylation domain-containing protein
VGLVKLPPTPTALRGSPSQEGKGDEYLLLVDMHHIITDGVSHKILIENFMNLYQGRGLPPLRLQYKDYSQWQQGGIVKEVLRQQEEFWMRQLAGEIPKLDMPTDFPRPALQSFAGNVLDFRIDRDKTNSLRKIAESQRATLFMVLLAIYNIFLSKISHQEDIVIGTPVAGRRHADLEQIIGVFINMLPLRNAPRGESTFAAFLKSLTEKTIEAFDHQDYAFEDLVEKVVIDRDLTRNPVFDVVLVMQNMFDPTGTVREHEAGDLTVKPYDNQERKAAQFDLTLYTSEMGDILNFTFEYCTSLFKEETIARFIQYFNQATASVIENPDKNISHIEIISEEEKVQVLKAFNTTEAEYPVNETISRLFARQVEQIPDNIAVIAPWKGPAVQLSYWELNERSGRLALWLREKGVEPDTIVGIMVERSLEMIIGIMGILKSGGAYLPIDPGYPEARIQYMLKDSNAKILLKDNDFTPEVFNNHPKDAPIPPSTLLTFYPSDPTNLAYIIYTSGSTGKPKGVMIEHKSVVNLLFALQRSYPFRQTDAYLFKTSYVFDVSVTELFGWYMGGGRLVILEKGGEKDPQAMLASLERTSVTHVNFVPSMFNIFIEHVTEKNRNQLSSLKYIFLAGEVLLPLWVKKFRDLGTTILLENIYGPTESTVYASQYSLTEWEGPGPIPIGKPLSNLRLYILDKNGCIQPVNIVGELCISGIGLARGYLNQPGLTAERFCHRYPVAPSPHSPIYRTGDLARWLSSGEIEFLGRMDNQVKIRGFRVELGEIESRLSGLSDIMKAVVMNKSSENGDKYLCAYIVADKEIDTQAIRDSLANVLPDYMIPSQFIQMEKIPLTTSGKIDRKALPDPKIQAGKDYTAPRHELEKKLAEIWSRILGIEARTVGIDSNFFTLGGHSLNAIMMISKIHKELNVKLTLADLFKTPTVKGLSQYIKSAVQDKYKAILPVEEREYYNVTHSQKRLWVLSQVKEASLTFNLPFTYLLEGKLNKNALSKIFETMIERHESLRTVFITVEDEPKQKILSLKETGFALEHIDLRGIENKELKAREWVNNEMDICFDLMKGPLLRVKLIRLEEEKYLFLFTMHHIISDNASMEVLLNEILLLSQRYREGKEKALEPLRIQYKDYAAWQNERFIGKKKMMLKNYWLNQLQGELPVLALPTDRKRPGIRGYDGKVKSFYIDEELTGQLRSLSKQNDVTLFMTLLTVLKVLFYRYTGQTDIIVGTPVAGREHADLEDQIGFYINTLALRTRFSTQETFETLLKKIKKVALGAYENQLYPFDELVESLGIKRDLSRHPIFDVMVDMTRVDFFENMQPETSSKSIPLDSEYKKSKFDITFYIYEEKKSLKINVEYSVALFEIETISRLCKRFQILVNHIVKNPLGNISDFPIEEGLEFSTIRPITRARRPS